MHTGHPRPLTHGRVVRVVAATVCAVVVAALAQLVVVATPATAAAPVVVTLTYDDGVADVAQAGALMAARGLRGTFYVNSGPIGSSGYMTRADLDALAAAGHEIGGHTVTHANLVTLSDAELHRQVCTDRNTLLGWGFPAVSFAYPYSSLNAAVEQAVVDCGYDSARQVGDIVSPGACQGCDVAETIPPADPFYTRAPDSVMSTWSVADMEGLVTQAQRAGGGGWVQVVFHHLCTGCDPYAATVDDYTAFLDWVAGQVASGAVVVRTVSDVIGGPVKPAVPAPAPRAAAGPGVNGLLNDGVEASTKVANLPDCWQAAGYGTNSAAFARVTGAHSGSWAERVTMTSRTSGDRKLLPTMDLGDCAPSVVPSATYAFSAWYVSTVPTPVVAYWRNGSGRWSYLGGSSALPASADWSQARWTLPALPADATAVSVGLALNAVGTLTTDDYALVDVTAVPDPGPVRNAGLELAAGSVPDCFQASSTGTTTGSAARVSSPVHGGAWAYQVTISARTSGDRKLVTKQDAGTCAPAAVAGHAYAVSAWYVSSVPVPFVTYYRNASGAWVYWQTSAPQAAASTWQQASFTTAALPAGATAVSFGLALNAVGTLTTDDYGLLDLG